MKLLGRKQKQGPPDRPFSHGDGCPIVKADPSVEIPWSEVERGYWEAVCVCGRETYQEPVRRGVKLDPLDPKVARHLGGCEYAHETDPATLRLLLKVTDKLDYNWVECSVCASGWQVPHYGGERRDSLKSKAAR